MTAPESVVQALRDVLAVHVPAVFTFGQRCSCGGFTGSLEGMDDHIEQAVAAATHAASLEWAAEQLAPAWPNPVVPPADRLRRWARGE